jgi:hypothetical protein
MFQKENLLGKGRHIGLKGIREDNGEVNMIKVDYTYMKMSQ